MPCSRVSLIACLHLGILLASAPSAVLGQCQADCTCGDADSGDGSLTRVEGLAAAVAALTPMVLGGAGLGLYKLLTSAMPDSSAVPDASLPKQPVRGGRVAAGDKDSSSLPPYPGQRRGSVPLSLFSEDEDFSMDDGSPRSSFRPDTSSTYTNIHRPNKKDAVNRWL